MLTREGIRTLLHNMVEAEDAIVIRLFVNDHTPTASDTLKTFKEPPRAAGYQPHRCAAADWEVQEDLAITYPDVEFRFTRKVGRVYGHFATQRGVVLWAYRFDEDAPIFMKREGDATIVIPRIEWVPQVPVEEQT